MKKFKIHRKLHQLVEEDEFMIHLYATDVNAYYNRYNNAVYIPAALLSLPTFDTNRPNYLNYGSLGTIIGHEIGHGFNNYNQRVRWSRHDYRFFTRTECFQTQLYDMGIIGRRKVNENIADNVGTKAAYGAYHNFVSLNGEEAKLTLEYSQQQLFWISAAQGLCEIDSGNKINTNSSSLQRVNNMVQNMFAFATDFNCSQGSNMNPIRKCKLW